MIILDNVLYIETTYDNEQSVQHLLAYVATDDSATMFEFDHGSKADPIFNELINAQKQLSDHSPYKTICLDNSVTVTYRQDSNIIWGKYSLLYKDTFKLKSLTATTYTKLQQANRSNKTNTDTILAISKIVRNRRGKLTLRDAARSLIILKSSNLDYLRDIFCLDEANLLRITNELINAGIIDQNHQLLIHNQSDLAIRLKQLRSNPDQVYSTIVNAHSSIQYDLPALPTIQLGSMLLKLLKNFVDHSYSAPALKTLPTASSIICALDEDYLADQFTNKVVHRCATCNSLHLIVQAIYAINCPIALWRAIMRYLAVNSAWIKAWYSQDQIKILAESLDNYAVPKDTPDYRLKTTVIERITGEQC